MSHAVMLWPIWLHTSYICACILNHHHHPIIQKFHTSRPHSSSSVFIHLKVVTLVFCLLSRHLLPSACETWLVDKQIAAWWGLCQAQFLTSLPSRLFPGFNQRAVTRNQSHHLGKMLNQHKSQLYWYIFTAPNWQRGIIRNISDVNIDLKGHLRHFGLFHL